MTDTIDKLQQEELHNKNSFINKVKNIYGTRTHKITNSYGVYDAFKYYRKHRNKKSKVLITDSQYFSIIRLFNKGLIDLLLNNKSVLFPYKMGALEIRKYKTHVLLTEDGIKTNKPIDWESTLALWYEDADSYNNKVLIRRDVDEIFRILFLKNKACFINKTFYNLAINRAFKKLVQKQILNNELEAYLIK